MFALYIYIHNYIRGRDLTLAGSQGRGDDRPVAGFKMLQTEAGWGWMGLMRLDSVSLKSNRSFCRSHFISMMSWMKAPNLSSRFSTLQLTLLEFPQRIKGSIHHTLKKATKKCSSLKDQVQNFENRKQKIQDEVFHKISFPQLADLQILRQLQQDLLPAWIPG